MSAHRIAEAVEPPALDVDGVRRRVRSGRRWRRIGIAAVVTAAVTLLLLVPRLLDSPVAEPVDRPSGSVPAGAVWADADGLHLGHRVVALPFNAQERLCGEGLFGRCSPFTSLALVSGGVVYDHAHRIWYQPWSGKPTVIGEADDAPNTANGEQRQVGPAGDPDGTTAAWFDGTELVMYETASGTELARADQPEGTLPGPVRENGHGNYIVEVTSEAVTWYDGPGALDLYRFDRRADQTTRTSRSSTLDSGDGGVLDVNAGRIAVLNGSDVVDVFSPAGATTLSLKPGLLSGLVGRFNADGRYLAGITEKDAYHAVVADTHNGHIFIPSRKDAYPWIGWGYGDTLMVIQDHEGTDDGNPHDRSRLLACDISARTCHGVTYRGVITLPND